MFPIRYQNQNREVTEDTPKQTFIVNKSLLNQNEEGYSLLLSVNIII